MIDVLRLIQNARMASLPDSEMGELLGLSGTKHIVIDKGKHSYEFQYSLSG